MPKWQKIVIGVLLIILAIVLIDKYYPDAIETIANQEINNTDYADYDSIKFADEPTIKMTGNIATITGKIKNTSSKRCHNISLELKFYSKKGEEIESKKEIIALTLEPKTIKDYSVTCDLKINQYGKCKYKLLGWYNTTGL